MWLFYTCVTRKLHVRKKLHELLRTLQLHASCVYLDGSCNLFLFVHAQCVYFSQSKVAYRVYGATKSNLKLSELKLPFGVFNNRYTCSFHNKFHFIAAGTGIIHVTLCLQFEVQDSVFESHVSFTEVDKIKSRTFFHGYQKMLLCPGHCVFLYTLILIQVCSFSRQCTFLWK